jgi:MFS family permease
VDYICSIVLVFASLGVVVANLIHTSVVTWMNPEKILDFGWRVAFVGSGLIVFHCYYFARNTLKEPLIFREMQQSQKTDGNAIHKIAKHYKSLLICVFLPKRVLPPTGEFWLPIFPLIVLLFLVISIGIAIGNIAGGIIADKLGIRKAYLFYRILMAAIRMPTFYYALKNSTPIIHLLIAMGILAFLTGFMNSAAQYLASSLFPAEIRFSGVAICQSLGMVFLLALHPFMSAF